MKNTILFTAGSKTLPEMQLTIGARFGAISIDSLIAYDQFILEDEPRNKDFDILIDTRNMDWDFVISDVQIYVRKLLELNGAISNKNKIATYSSPHQLAYTYIVQKEFAKANQKMEFFRELAPAINWLNKSITPEEVEHIIKEMKENPPFKWNQEIGYNY
ncbi:MAG: hypothetical protein P4L28_05740 [Paludibacteraceae bacterium]|nr:hypothetical protein [Paludibacteraceae bacterium]